MSRFDDSVFINCPFDADYRQLLVALIFTVKYLRLVPRLALENADSAETRVANILDLIKSSRFGIHDLSRIQSTRKKQYFRMNMPFELGVDYGCKKLRVGKWSGKKLLVLEKEKFRYQAALSDFAGSDIHCHEDDPVKLVKVVRDWVVSHTNGKGPGHTKIWYDFNDFSAYLEHQLLANGHQPKDYETVPIPEVMVYMDEWFSMK